MDYEIDKELTLIAMYKIPANVKMLPVLNAAMKIFKCKSDHEVTVTTYLTPGYDGAQLSTYVIEPAGCNGKLPCMVYFHGGGFILRASAAHLKLAKWYAKKANCKVVFTDYRLAPEYMFPTAPEDCYHTFLWAVEQANVLGIDTERIIVGGDSAGGNLAIAVALMLKERKKADPCGVLLVYPVTDRRMNTQSMHTYTDAPVWDPHLSEMMWKVYLGEGMPEPVGHYSPMEAESLLGFPKTYAEVAEFDCLHDEGVDFCERLKKEGVDVELHDIKGGCHGFESALGSNMVKEAMQRRIAWLRKCFGD